MKKTSVCNVARSGSDVSGVFSVSAKSNKHRRVASSARRNESMLASTTYHESGVTSKRRIEATASKNSK